MFHWFGARKAANVPASADAPRAFGWNTQWLAVPARDPTTVVRALAKLDPRIAQERAVPCSWAHGIACGLGNAKPKGVFFTPPQSAHVVGLGYVPRHRSLEEYRRVLAGLSAELDARVCLLGSYRHVSGIVLAVAERSELVRAYVHSDGRTELAWGERLPEEIALQLRYCEDLTDNAMDDALLAGEQQVLQLADKLSVDPSRFGSPPFDQAGVGVLAY